MKKIVFFAAFFAALSGFTSCSNDDDLTQPEKPVVEEGTPFGVRVSTPDDGTRFTALSSITSFKLWGVQQSSPKNMWLNGITFTGNSANSASDWSMSTSKTWPTENVSSATTFYGIADGTTLSEGAATGNPANLTPTINETGSAQFTYNFGELKTSTLHFFTEALKNLAAYQATSSVVVPEENQLDLLVASTSSTEEAATEGAVNIDFTHALSSLVINAEFYDTFNGDPQSGIDKGEQLDIYWIRVINLYGGGTYDFATGKWTVDTDRPVVYEYVPTEVIHITAQSHQHGDKKKFTNLVPAGKFLIVPQTYTPWDGNGQLGGSTPIYSRDYGNMTTQAYVEMCIGRKGAENQKARSVLPLKVNVSGSTGEFLAGKQHTIMLTLNMIQKVDTDNTSINKWRFEPTGFVE